MAGAGLIERVGGGVRSCTRKTSLPEPVRIDTGADGSSSNHSRPRPELLWGKRKKKRYVDGESLAMSMDRELESAESSRLTVGFVPWMRRSPRMPSMVCAGLPTFTVSPVPAAMMGQRAEAWLWSLMMSPCDPAVLSTEYALMPS